MSLFIDDDIVYTEKCPIKMGNKTQFRMMAED